MPLTKLSERFYQKFGHDLVEELVTWLNQMDTTYRSDLRELNELNFARFDAKLEQRAAELEARIAQSAARLDAKIDEVAGILDGKIDEVAGILDAKIDEVTGILDAKIDEVAGTLDAKIDQRAAELRTELHGISANLFKWMFVFWAGTVVPLAGLMFALFQHFRP